MKLYYRAIITDNDDYTEITLTENSMLEINKNYVLDNNQKTIAVQIPIAEFEKIEEILEDYGLVKLIEEVENEPTLSKEEALKYLASLNNNNVES
jgi:hypothetical protein